MTEAPRLEGLVLRREPAGERHLRLTLLDAEHGAVMLLHKPAAKSGAPTVTPDLFDDAEVFTDTPRGGASASRFIREYRLIRRRTGLARDFNRLEIASRLAHLLAANPHPSDSGKNLLDLSRTAFDALESRPAPEATALKFLWKLARDEGWPVREHWERRLPRGLAESLRRILTSPLDTIPADEIAPARELTRRLEQWLADEAHYTIAP